MSDLPAPPSRAARSILVFGLYMAAQGLALMTVPNLLLELAGAPPTHEPWVRIVGWCLVVLGTYYALAARSGWVAFFRATVVVRLAQLGFFAILVATGQGAPILLGFSAVEAAAGVWTALELRRSSA